MESINIITLIESSRIFAFFLAFLPSILNIAIVVYVLKKLPRNLLTSLFLFFVGGLICWQISDMLRKVIEDPSTVHFISDLLWVPSVIVAPIGLHFALLFVNKKRQASSPFILLLIYGPFVLFEAGARTGFVNHPLVYHEFWGWILAPSESIWSQLELYWIMVVTFLTLLILLQYAFIMRNNNLRQIQTLLLTVGLAIPVIQGSITQVIFPYFLNLPEVPLTSFFMTFFSVAAYLALTKHELLNFTPEYATSMIINNMSDGLCVIDHKQKILLHNTEFTTLLGKKESDLTGFNLDDIDRMNFSKIFDHRMDLPAQYEIEVKTDEGKQIFLLIRLNNILNKQGNPIGLILILTDISQRIYAEKKLKERNEELSIFLYRTSHDMRSPLSSVMGISNLMKQNNDPEESKLYIEMIDKSIKNLDSILSELLLISIIMQKIPNAEKVDLNNELSIVLEEIKNKDNSNNIQFIINSNLLSDFYTDKEFVQPILKQLINNSIIYSSDKNPSITIEIEEISSGVSIKVIDNGMGMNEQVLEKCCNMFYRGSIRSKGSGLGLFVVKKAADKLNGTITIVSTQNYGTTVTINIPNMVSNSNKEEKLTTQPGAKKKKLYR